MGKGKDPRRRRAPKPDATSDELEPQRQTQEKVDLVPPPPGRGPFLFGTPKTRAAVPGWVPQPRAPAPGPSRRGLGERARWPPKSPAQNHGAPPQGARTGVWF